MDFGAFTGVFTIAGIVAVAWWVYMYLSGATGATADTAPPSGITAAPMDQPSGNSIPMKTIQPFKKISDYMFSPWDPLNNSERHEFMDADNMPRVDYLMPGGNRLVTYGFVNHGKSNRPPFPTHGAHPGATIAFQRPIQATTNKKNLNLANSLWHSGH